MKLITLIAGLMFSACAFAGLLSEKDVKWEPIIGYNHPTLKSYFDKGSLSTSVTDVGKTSIGNVLISSKTAETVPINGSTIQVHSIVRMVMMNCDSGLTIPIVDFYFDKPLPTNNDKPVRIYFFSSGMGVEMSDKKSILYKLLCPEYI